MSGLSSIQHIPVGVPLPTMDVWQNWYASWGNVLRGRKEGMVDHASPGAGVPRLSQALKQNVTGLAAHEVIMVKHRARQVLTAIRTVEDRLHLVSWRVNADGSILQTGSSNAQIDAIHQACLARARNYVVACRTHTGELQFSRWDVSNTGAIYLAGESTQLTPRLRWLEMAVLDADHVVTVVLTETGVWQLMLWQLQGEDGMMLQHTQSLPVAAASRCRLSVCLQADGTVCVFTLLAENLTTLTLHVWHYSPGTNLTLVATHPIPMPNAATLVSSQTSGDQLLAVVQMQTGQLRLLSWHIAAGQSAPVCTVDDLLYEGTGYCTCQSQRDGFVLFYRTLAGELQLQRWQQQPDGTLALLAAGHAPTAVGEVSCCDDLLDGNAPFLMTTIDHKGIVTLTTWQ